MQPGELGASVHVFTGLARPCGRRRQGSKSPRTCRSRVGATAHCSRGLPLLHREADSARQ
eukprot:758984-Pyramimonas_sp.AAC.1